MNKTLLSLTFAGIFAAGLAVAGAASAHITKSDLGYQDAAQPGLHLVRGGGAENQDPFKELRERRQQQQEQQSRSGETQNGKSEDAGQKETKDDDSEGGFFNRLFDS